MLKLWELALSPNNTKVRMALRFKGVDFEAIPLDPRDRSAVLEASGQEGRVDPHHSYVGTMNRCRRPDRGVVLVARIVD